RTGRVVMRQSTVRVLGLAVPTLFIFACGALGSREFDSSDEGKVAAVRQRVSATLTAVASDTATASIPAGTNKAVSAARLHPNTRHPLRSGLRWTSSDVTVAVIDIHGKATARQPGTTTMTVEDTASHLTASATLLVTARTLNNIVISIPSKSLPQGAVESITV